MCTVTYIPQSEDSYILTSNRDEAPKRAAIGLEELDFGHKKILFPRDPKANGTWIASSNTNQLVCLLNGAFEKHQHKPPYKMSRGLMVLDFFKHASALHFFHDFDFEGMEPFTLIVVEQDRLYELRWDEKKKHLKTLNPKENHIWSSSTLYPAEWKAKRKDWFTEWENNQVTVNQASILNFHKNGGESHPHFGFVMNYKDIVRTVSISSIQMNPYAAKFRYEDLLSKEVENKSLAMGKQNQ